MSKFVVCLLFVAVLHISVSQVIESQLKYYLYTPAYPTTPLQITRGNIPFGVIDPTKPIKVLIHGFNSNANTTFTSGCRQQYFARGYTNVLAVDWSAYASNLLGTSDVVPVIGNFVGLLMIDIADQFSVPWSQFHLIGHSLGAQISGFAGQTVLASEGQKLGRITALDPASSGYVNAAPANRLSVDDADLVDSIHTSNVVAYSGPVGLIDFFPNNGRSQPGCSLLLIDCNHMRSISLFIESINSNLFVGYKCSAYTQLSSCMSLGNMNNIMGEDVIVANTGSYYLKTKGSSNFACGPSNIC